MNKVFSAKDEFVQRTLRDFRVWENGQRWIARLKGEGRFRSAAFPELAESHVLVEMIPVTEWNRPSLVTRWFSALRLPYLTISLLPLLLVACARWNAGLPGLITFLLFACVTLIHLGCNLWGDVEDHLRGVDNPGQSGGSGVIQKLWIPAVHLRWAAALLFLAGLAAGVLLLFQLPLELVRHRLIWVGLIGALGAASYSGWPFHYKYLGLGEPIVFLLAGPVVTFGAAALYFVGTEELLRFAWLSLPLSLLVTLRLHGGNMQRIPFDTIAGVLTIARVSGFRWSKVACYFLAAAPFLAVAALVGLGIAPTSSLVCVLALPLAARVMAQVRVASGPLDPVFLDLRYSAAYLHLAFGLLYCFSFLRA